MVRLLDMPYSYAYTKMYWAMVNRDPFGKYNFCGLIKLKPNEHITADHLRDVTILLNQKELDLRGQDIVILQNLSMELLMCRAVYFRTLNIHSKAQGTS